MVILQYCIVHNLLLTYNTVGLRRISFFLEIRSLQSVTNFFAQTPPPPPTKKCPRGAAPIGLSGGEELYLTISLSDGNHM